MRIIIDGNDGVGKTTLAKKLQKDLNIKSYIHLSNKDPRDFNFYSAILEKDDVIFDRSFMDEPIYSAVLNRHPKLLPSQANILHEYIKANNIIVIICFRQVKLYDDNEEKRIVNASEKIDNYFYALVKEHGYIYFDTERDYDTLVTLIKTLSEDSQWIQ